MYMSCRNLPGSKVFALAAAATGAQGGAMTTGRVYDLIITALVGGLAWLFLTTTGILK